MPHIFLSPHYDDAVYSCGGTIHQLVQQGHDVTILTIMAGVPSLPLPDTPVLQDNHERWQIGDNPVTARRREDKAAASILGANTEYLETIADCIYRTNDGEALYPTEESLWDKIHPDDPAIILLEQIDLSHADTIYAPLGVGGHVDHLIVRDWAISLSQKTDIPIRFYEDYPYLRDRKAVDLAREKIDAKLSPDTIIFTQDTMQSKIQAMLSYQSQIASFWESADAVSHEVSETFRGATDTTFVERYYAMIRN